MNDINWVPGAIRGLMSHFTTMLTAMKAEKREVPATAVVSCYTYDQGYRSTELTVKDVEYFLQSMGQLIREHADLRGEALTWTAVADGLPPCEKVNGYWSRTPVLVELRDGSRIGAMFSYHGGDDVYPEVPNAVPCFHTDEGLPYPGAVRWALIPQPKKQKARA